ncbi:hypothetical protein R3P38DRAFT_3236608 [Favolaschia claudopus]|uniref:Uncharacterized protein n=1 Tax=Favolaschia claudopus TaxID=2862362 RepID=A0AAV9YYE6_9AGAR
MRSGAPENWQAIFGANGLEILKTCRTCLEKKQKQKANAAAAAGNERKNERADNSVDASAFIGQPAVPAEDFFVALRNAGDVHNLTAYIDRESANLEVAQDALPTIRVVFNNQPVPSAPARPRIVINLNRHNVGNNTDSQAALEGFVDSLNDDDEEYLDDAGAEDLDLSDRPDAAPSWLEPGDKTTATCSVLANGLERWREGV